MILDNTLIHAILYTFLSPFAYIISFDVNYWWWVVEGVGRSWGWVPLSLSGQYLRTSCGLIKRNKRKPAPCSPELFFWSSGIPGAPEVFKMKRLLLATQSSWICFVLSTLTALTPTLFCEDKSWNLFFKRHETRSPIHKFKFMSNWNCFYMYSLSEKKH